MTMRAGKIFVAAISALSLVLTASLSPSQGIRIREIQFKGNRKVQEKTLRNLIKSRVGAGLDHRVLQEDIKNIFQTGYFEDVKVDADFSDEGVLLSYILREKQVVFRVSIRGNKEISTDDIRGVVTVKEKDFFSDEKVKESEEKIAALYNNNGYFEVRVTTEIVEREGNRIEIDFDIVEGEKLKIAAVDFRGNNFFSDKELKKAIETKSKGFFSWLTGSGTFKKDVFDNDLIALEVKYLDSGFLDVKIEKPEISKTEKGIKLIIRVFEGIQYRVGEVEITGDLPETMKGLSRTLRTKTFKVFSREKMVKDILDISRKLQDIGYADATVKPNYVKQKKYPVVDIRYEVDKGKKYRFGIVNVKGNTKTLDKVVRRRLAIADGEMYSATGLEQSKANLMRVGYFKDVKVVTKKGAKEREVDVDVEVEEASTGTVSGGFGFSSLDKFFGVVQISENNLFGRGWRLGLNTQFGSRRVIFSLDFRDPNFLDSKWSLTLNGYNTSVEYSEFTRDAKGGRIGFGYPLSRDISTGLTFRVDQVRIEDVDTTITNSVLQQEAEKGAQKTHSVTWDLTRNTTDNFINPTRGMVQSLSVEYAGDPLGGESEFVKYFINQKYYRPVIGKTIYAFNAEWGHAVSTVGGRVPLFERFFLGGPYSIRGFESRSITPIDENTGEEIGGNKEIVINNELIVPLYEEIGLKLILFFDAGNAFRQDDWPSSLSDLRYGAGFGLRWYSPMGPLRLEWGFNLDREDDEASRVVEFTIGTNF
ncbi:MAG: outer membrane protein assembly factor BamA [Deltaproteobacteria bacterium]|nr:outer membrane protein assembly factor BamA [Deltaproteobacteria bacterium]